MSKIVALVKGCCVLLCDCVQRSRKMKYLQPFLPKASWLIILLVWDTLIDVSASSSQSEVNKHLELGRDLLNRGQFQDALSHYHAAVEGDPNNYLTYFKRATVYLALGKAKFSLIDLDRVLELKPDFTSARLQRGLVHLKQAQLNKAAVDLENVLVVDPGNEEATMALTRISLVQRDIDAAYMYRDHGDYKSAVNTISKVLEICPWAADLRELRAECYGALGDTMSAISDIRSTTKLLSDNTVGFYKLSHLYYQLGEAEESLREVRECLKLDPEHKDCFPHYKKVKKVDKHMHDVQSAVNEKDWSTCIDSANKILKTEPSVPMVRFHANEKLCHCYLHSDQTSLAIEYCRGALEISKDPNILCDRAEAYINSEMFDDAIHDYKDALDMDENFQRAKEGLQRAQKLQKQAERRDYYKILGVRRTASKQEIIKAYRKAAQKWHPDNFHGDEKKIAEKKFIDIAAAKEVLTDPEKREKFDQGEDPLDPESQQSQGFNPFQHHHFHHGSPFQFRFHFN